MYITHKHVEPSMLNKMSLAIISDKTCDSFGARAWMFLALVEEIFIIHVCLC